MEFVQLQVKIATLNKAYFKQLREVKEKDYTAFPGIKGWVIDGVSTFFITELNGYLVKIRETELYWLALDYRIPLLDTLNVAPKDQAKAFYEKITAKYPQIFI